MSREILSSMACLSFWTLTILPNLYQGKKPKDCFPIVKESTGGCMTTICELCLLDLPKARRSLSGNHPIAIAQ